MKVLLLNGSSNKNGCTFTALNEAAKTLNQEGIKTEIFQLGNPEIRDCCGCQACRKLGKCVFEDGLVNEFIEKARSFDGFILELLSTMLIRPAEFYLFWIEFFMQEKMLLNLSRVLQLPLPEELVLLQVLMC